MSPTFTTIVHKFLRSEMFGVSAALSACDFTNDTALAQVAERINRITKLLHGHGEKEDEVYLPALCAKDMEAAARMERDHASLEARLDRVTAAIAALPTADRSHRESALLLAYLDWNAFLSAYLAHLDDEELRLFPLITEVVPGVADFAGSVALVPPEGRAAFLDALWKAVTPRERMEIEAAMAEQEASTLGVGAAETAAAH